MGTIYRWSTGNLEILSISDFSPHGKKHHFRLSTVSAENNMTNAEADASRAALQQWDLLSNQELETQSLRDKLWKLCKFSEQAIPVNLAFKYRDRDDFVRFDFANIAITDHEIQQALLPILARKLTSIAAAKDKLKIATLQNE